MPALREAAVNSGSLLCFQIACFGPAGAILIINTSATGLGMCCRQKQKTMHQQTQPHCRNSIPRQSTAGNQPYNQPDTDCRDLPCFGARSKHGRSIRDRIGEVGVLPLQVERFCAPWYALQIEQKEEAGAGRRSGKQVPKEHREEATQAQKVIVTLDFV